MGTPDRKRIADALYMLAAGADHDTLLSTMRRYVIVHSKSDDEVTDMLRELQEANPEGFATALLKVVKTDGAKIAKAATARQAKTRAKQRKRAARKQAS